MTAIHQHIEQRVDVMLGKPVVRGTRITVEFILERLAGGWSVEDLVREHPRLQAEDVRAALAYAAESIGSDSYVLPDEVAA